jgi:hypothetical protein
MTVLPSGAKAQLRTRPSPVEEVISTPFNYNWGQTQGQTLSLGTIIGDSGDRRFILGIPGLHGWRMRHIEALDGNLRISGVEDRTLVREQGGTHMLF